MAAIIAGGRAHRRSSRPIRSGACSLRGPHRLGRTVASRLEEDPVLIAERVRETRKEQIRRADIFRSTLMTYCLLTDNRGVPLLRSVMRRLIVVVILLLCGLAIWRPSLREIGIALVLIALVFIVGVGRLGIGFVRSTRPEPKRDFSDE